MAEKPVSPVQLRELLGNPTAAQRREQLKMEQLYNDGVTEGRLQVRKEMLNWLDKDFMANRRAGKTDRADALLEVTRDMAQYFRDTWHI